MSQKDQASPEGEPAFLRGTYDGPARPDGLTPHRYRWRGFAVDLVLRPVRGRRVVTELHLTTDPEAAPVGGLTSTLLRRLPLGGMVEDSLEIEALGEVRSLIHVGRRDDSFLAELAALYVELVRLGTRTPAVAMAQALEVSDRTVHAWLYRARRSGLLTKPGQGTASGELTDLAIALLPSGATDEGE